MSERLFRKQAMDQQREPLWGDVFVAIPLSLHLLAVIITATVVAAALLLSQGSYARKETVRGYLVPSDGWFKIYPARSGTLTELFIEEGQQLRQGDKLFRIVSEQVLSDGSQLNQRLIEELEQQIDWLHKQIDQQQRVHQLAVKQDQLHLTHLKADLEQLRRQKPLLQQRLELQSTRLASTEQLFAKQLIARTQLMAQQESLLQLQSEMQTTERSIANQQAQIAQAEMQLQQQPLAHASERAVLNRQLSDLHQRLTQAQGSNAEITPAPIDGTVTSLQAWQGQQIVPGKPLMMLLPEPSALQAELFLPTSAIGFVEPGQKVRLRYAAFPYQRFGTYQGEVIAIDRSILLPREVDAPFALEEPVYRLFVTLAQQSISAFGKSLPLQPGMLLEADIKLSERSLGQWLLEPLYSLKGRL